MQRKMRYASGEIKNKLKTLDDKNKFSVIVALENNEQQHEGGWITARNASAGYLLWFSWEDHLLAEMFNNGFTDNDIAQSFRTTIISIASRRKKLQLKRNKELATIEFKKRLQQCITDKLTYKQAAEKLNVSPSTITKLTKKFGLSFRKLGSEHHRSKLSEKDRATIVTLHDHGYMPEHISKALSIDIGLIRCAIYSASTIRSEVDINIDPRLVGLLTCNGKFGQFITPAEIDLVNNEGIDAYMTKTGRSEQASMMKFVYRQQSHKFQLNF